MLLFKLLMRAKVQFRIDDVFSDDEEDEHANGAAHRLDGKFTFAEVVVKKRKEMTGDNG